MSKSPAHVCTCRHLQSERYDKDKRNMDRDEAGNIIYRQGYAGNYNNPSRWSAGPSISDDFSNDFGSSSGRGRGRGGRGDRGRGRQQFEQREQYQQAARGGYGNWGQGGSYNDGYDSGGRGRGRGRGRQRQQQQGRQQWQQQEDDGGWFGGGAAGGRDDSVRLEQMDWMGEMGSGRYSDDEGPDAAHGSYDAAGRGGRQIGGWDDSWRQQQMSYMEEMGSGRYSDEGCLSGSGDEWQPPPPRRAAPGGAAGAAPAGRGVGRAFGGTGEAVRRGQMSYMEEMGSGRYSDDEGADVPGAGAGAWGAAAGDVGGKDESVRQRQMDFMGEMGSGRYSDMDDSGDEYFPPPRATRGQKQQRPQQRQERQHQRKGSLRSEFADAFDGLEANSDLLRFGSDDSFGSGLDSPSSSRGATQRNNRQRGMDAPAAAGPGKASYMEEDGFGWGQGDVSGDFDNEGPAIAKHLHDAWQQDGEPDVWGGYGDAGFDDQIAAVAGEDPLLQQLASMPDNASNRQQQQQRRRQAPGGRQQQQRAARGGRRGGRASSAGRGGRGAAKADSWKLAADGPDDADGFEDGWADRMMSDGNDKVGLDDVMRS
jgi:hypothetical protein